MNENEGTEIAHRTAEAWLAENELIPLALVALQADESIELVADRLRDVVRFDDVGMRVIPSVAAREFFFERAEQEARVANQARRLEETHEPSPIPVGVPALEDASPFASLMAADSSYASPSEEFGGRPKPRFVQEAIEQGERQLAAAQAEAEAKKAARHR
jgi:hypothetical protein